MKAIYHILLTILALTLCCCQDDSNSLSSVGYLRLAVTENGQLNTRAYDPKIMAVKIQSEDGEIVKEIDDLDEWDGEVLELPVGNYEITAFSKDYQGEPAFNSPFYYGDTTVQVKAATETTAKVNCKIANVKVTVNYSEEFKTTFAGRDIFVTVGSADEKSSLKSMVFKYGSDAALYFPSNCGPLKATLNVSNPNGGYYTLDETEDLAEPKANDHFILNYHLGDTNKGDFTVTVDPTTNSYSYTFYINMTPVSVSAICDVNAWATFAYLKASNVESTSTTVDPANVSFQYRKKGATDWTKIETVHDNGVYTAQPTGLEGAIEYEYCLAVGKENTNVETFTTEETVILYNGGFDDWNKGTGDYKDVWFPEIQANATIGKSYWDSGNIGTAAGLATILGACNPTEPEYDDVKKGTAGKLTSQYVGVAAFDMGKFAAGNIYTGHFCETYTDIYGARIRFGQPFNSRPIQLRGWYKYKRGTNVNYPSGNSDYKTELINSGGDKCAIYIALTDNIGLAADNIPAAAFEIDNKLNADQPDKFKYKNTIDYSENNPHIIAYGTITDEEAKGTGNWQEFTIDLKYRDLTRKPKYIIVVASASKYGDFFTGSEGSVMYIDNFELVYDGEPKKEE